VASGDQQDGRWVAGERPEFLNYQYRNGFRFDDFRRSAELYKRLKPELMISGHWLPRPVTDDYLDALLEAGTELEKLHHELLPLDTVDFGGSGFGARIEPYRSSVSAGGVVDVSVLVRNPFRQPSDGCVQLVVPAGWEAEPPQRVVGLTAGGEERVTFRLRVGSQRVRRARIGADLTVGEVRFGQHAEALVDVT
jgi:hypothetical protein